MSDPPDADLAAALRWMAWHGNLVGFPCPDDAVRGLFLTAIRRGLVTRGDARLRLSPAGEQFLAQVPNRPCPAPASSASP